MPAARPIPSRSPGTSPYEPIQGRGALPRWILATGAAAGVALLGGLALLLFAQGRSPVPTLPIKATSHQLSGTLTAYTPYTSMNESTGKCQVSDVQREVTAGVSVLYPESEPSRFPDITEGAAITVKDADGRTVAASRLGAAKLVEPYETTAPGYPDGADAQIRTVPEQVAHGFCAYQFTVPDLPDSSFYRVQFGAQPEMTLSRSELQQADWTWNPTLGVAEVARRETEAWYSNLCVKAAGLGGRC